MIAIVCLDDRDGMMFHKRRQSKDRVVVEQILELSAGKELWIHPFSEKLFVDKAEPGGITVDESFLEDAGEGAYCFVENRGLKAVENRLEKLIIFRWNRHYPSDVKLDLRLEDWTKTQEEEFAGYSHEKITREVYER